MASRNSPQQKDLIAKITLLALSVVVCLIFTEVALRLLKGSILDTENVRARKKSILTSYMPVIHDPYLGWALRPGSRTGNELWYSKSVSIDANGFRMNGPHALKSPTAVAIAVGDSFTFGDRVSDNETWPAQLEQMLPGIRVLNAGVGGYGLDQIVLTAERLASSYNPDYMILNFIWDDISRCQNSVSFGGQKPYFTILNNRLSLNNIPIPSHHEMALDSPLKHLLGYSYAIHSIMIRLNPKWWLDMNSANKKVHDKGLDIASLLLRRFDEMAQNSNILSVIIFSGDGSHSKDFDRLVSSIPLKSKVINMDRLYGHLIETKALRRDELFDTTNHPTPLAHHILASELKNLISP